MAAGAIIIMSAGMKKCTDCSANIPLSQEQWMWLGIGFVTLLILAVVIYWIGSDRSRQK